jgi:hypothetical protein
MKKQSNPDEPVFIPNPETVAAMEEARASKLKSFDSVEALMADLNEPEPPAQSSSGKRP